MQNTEKLNKLIKGFSSKYSLNKLVYFEMYGDAGQAITREKELKKYKREWKIKLIEKDNPNWDDLYSQII